MNENCVFCKIVSGKINSTKIYEDKDILAFLPKEMEARGHTLVIPKKHYKDIFDIPEINLKKIIKVIKNLSGRLKSDLGATGVNLLHASGENAQQSIYHFHIHIIPRFANDGIDAWMKKSSLGTFDRKEIQEILK